MVLKIFSRLAAILALFMSLSVQAGWSWFDDSEPEPVAVQVAEPYIELRTGAGRGYPIFHIVERGQQITLLKRKTDWYKVRTPRGKEGWVSVADIEKTMQEGQLVAVSRGSLAEAAGTGWEGGIAAGDVDGANLLSVYGGYTFNPHLTAELTLSQGIGDVSDSTLIDAGLIYRPFPDWRVMPFAGIGGGYIRVDPDARLVQTDDRDNATLHGALGARVYLARRFLLRAEYREYVVITDRNENETLEAWKLGFSVYF